MTTNDLRPDPCLFDPILANANATIEIEATTIWGVDPNTGNYTSLTSVPVTARATLVVPRRSEREEFPGVNQKNHLLSGYLVDPKTLPEDTEHFTEGKLTIDDGYFIGLPREGKCRLWIDIQNPYVQLELGTKILIELVEDQ